jgi:hypothetical protein
VNAAEKQVLVLLAGGGGLGFGGLVVDRRFDRLVGISREEMNPEQQ